MLPKADKSKLQITIKKQKNKICQKLIKQKI